MRHPARPAPAHRRRGNPASWPRRLAVTVVLAVASTTVLVTGIATPAFAGTLVSPGWAASATAPGTLGVDYTYTFTTASTSELDSVTMTVPDGTSGSPSVGTVTPAGLADGGSVSLSGSTLTYSFTPGTVAAGTAVSIEITGLGNTTVAGSYTSDIATVDAGTPVDSGTTPAVGFSGALVSPEWAVSTAAPGATGVDYTYTFTTASTSELDSVTMTVPDGDGRVAGGGHGHSVGGGGRGDRVARRWHADLLVHAGDRRRGDRGVDRDHRAGQHPRWRAATPRTSRRWMRARRWTRGPRRPVSLSGTLGQPGLDGVRYGPRGHRAWTTAYTFTSGVVVGAGFGDDDGARGDGRVAGGGHGSPGVGGGRRDRVPRRRHPDLLVHAGNRRGGDRGVDRDHRAGQHRHAEGT